MIGGVWADLGHFLALLLYKTNNKYWMDGNNGDCQNPDQLSEQGSGDNLRWTVNFFGR